jgi:hypothetical protein
VTKLNHAKEEGIGIGEKRGIEKGIESVIMAFFMKGTIVSGMEAAQAVGYPEERTQELLDQAQSALKKQQQNDSESMSGPQMGM